MRIETNTLGPGVIDDDGDPGFTDDGGPGFTDGGMDGNTEGTGVNGGVLEPAGPGVVVDVTVAHFEAIPTANEAATFGTSSGS